MKLGLRTGAGKEGDRDRVRNGDRDRGGGHLHTTVGGGKWGLSLNRLKFKNNGSRYKAESLTLKNSLVEPESNVP